MTGTMRGWTVRLGRSRAVMALLGSVLAVPGLGMATSVSAAAAGSAEAASFAAVAADARAAKPQVGSASYYHDSLAGRKTASGVRYDPGALVAAHRTLPFGTRVRVTNLSNGKAIEVKIVDRGPFAKGRIIDLSRAAAQRLGFIEAGHTRVRLDVLGRA